MAVGVSDANVEFGQCVNATWGIGCAMFAVACTLWGKLRPLQSDTYISI